MKCALCKKDWKIERLCPNCWNEMLEAQRKEKIWKCKVCGEDFLLQVETIEEGDRIRALICPKCRVIYKPF